MGILYRVSYVELQSQKAESKPTNLIYCTLSHEKGLFPWGTTLTAPRTLLEVALVMNFQRRGSINYPV